MDEKKHGFDLGEDESVIIRDIYKCAMEPKNWRNVLTRIQERLGALEATLMFYDAGVRARNFAAAARADEKMVARFVSEFIDIEAAVARKTMEGFNEGTVIDVEALRKQIGETYENSLGDASQFDTRPEWEVQLAVPLLDGASVYCSMGVYHSPGEKILALDAYDFIGRLAPHMVQSIRIFNHISSLQQENTSLYASIQRSSLGIFLLDQCGSVVFSNTEAMRIVKGGTIKISRFGKLKVENNNDQQKLDIILEKLLQDKYLYEGTTLPVWRFKSPHPFKVTVVSISSRSISERSVRLAVFVNDPDRALKIPYEYIQQVYKLTRVECDIVQSLLDTLSIETVAGGRGTTLGTARWQVKKIMEKTQCHTQAELVKLMLTLCDNFSIHQ